MKSKTNVIFYLIILLQGLGILSIKGFSLDFLLIFSILVTLSYISKEDWNTGYIFLKDNLIVLFLAFIYAIINKYTVNNILTGLLSFPLPLLLIEIVYQRFNKDSNKILIGHGDIILISSMCMVLGVERFIIVLFISSIGVIIASKIKKENIIPYGPFLHIGFLISYLFGNNILNLIKTYMRL